MAKEKLNLKDNLRRLRVMAGTIQTVDCTEEENEAFLEQIRAGKPLPEGVFQYHYTDNDDPATTFYRIKDSLTDDEKQEYIRLKQLEMIRTIKNCVVFFTALIVICLVFWLILSLAIGGGIATLFSRR